MTNVLIIGATSSIGQAATKYLLNKTDDNITLMARYTGLLSVDDKRERVFQGDIINEGILEQALDGTNVVILDLNENQETMVQKVINAMNKIGVERLIFITSMGISNEVPVTPGASGDLTEDSILQPYRQAVNAVENSDLNYTIVRPTNLDNGADTDNYVITHNGKPSRENHVARQSVADLILRLTKDKKLGSHDDLAISRKEA